MKWKIIFIVGVCMNNDDRKLKCKAVGYQEKKGKSNDCHFSNFKIATWFKSNFAWNYAGCLKENFSKDSLLQSKFLHLETPCICQCFYFNLKCYFSENDGESLPGGFWGPWTSEGSYSWWSYPMWLRVRRGIRWLLHRDNIRITHTFFEKFLWICFKVSKKLSSWTFYSLWNFSQNFAPYLHYCRGWMCWNFQPSHLCLWMSREVSDYTREKKSSKILC